MLFSITAVPFRMLADSLYTSLSLGTGNYTTKICKMLCSLTQDGAPQESFLFLLSCFSQGK